MNYHRNTDSPSTTDVGFPIIIIIIIIIMPIVRCLTWLK